MPSKVKRRLASPEALDAAAAHAFRTMARQGIRGALVGGYLMQHHGSDRLTADVDVIASGVPRGEKIARRLTFGGASTTAPNGVAVDYIVRDDRYARLYKAALRKAKNGMVGLPYLMALKLASGRPKDEEDLKFLLLRYPTQLALAEAVCERYLGIYAADELGQLAEIARWEKRRGKR